MNSWDEGDPDEVVNVGPYREIDRPIAAWCDPEFLYVRLCDQRLIANPLWWYPRLLAATPAQRNNIELMLSGIHWPGIDEDVAVEHMLQGCKPRNAVDPGTASTDLGYRAHDPARDERTTSETNRSSESFRADAA